MTLRRLRALAVIVIALGCWGLAGADERAKVVRAISGDALEVKLLDEDRRLERVHLIGVQAPDPGSDEPYSKEARQYLQILAAGELVDLVTDDGVADRDATGRLQRYAVFLWSLDTNGEIIRTGHARASLATPFKRMDVYLKMEAEACRRKAGGWGASGAGWGSCGGGPAASAGNRRPATGGEPVVYLARRSWRYHTSDCPLLKGLGMMVPLAKAQARGMKPCKICSPPDRDRGGE